MRTAGLVTRVRSAESPAVWLLAVGVCRVARRVSRHRSRWSSRLGYALERLDTAREHRREAVADRRWSTRAGRTGGQAAGLLRQAKRSERAEDWAGAAAAYQQAVQLDGAHPGWWYRLGWCRRAAGDPAGAVAAVRTACELDDTNPRWFGLLAEVEEGAGELAAAAAALRRAVALAGDEQPQWRLKLANLLDRAGEWTEAQQVLRDNLTPHRDHAASLRRLGEVSAQVAQWGGSFTGTLAGQAAGRFRFDQPVPAAASAARAALERAAELEPAKTTWREPLAEARLADGDLPGAIGLYEAALRDAEQSTGRWVLAVKHRWQFQLESIHHQLGRPRVVDPLFDCAVAPADRPGDAQLGDGLALGAAEAVPGLFTARVVFGGLLVRGLAAQPGFERVEIWLDDVLVRAVKLGGDGFFAQFQLELKRATLAYFPRQSVLTVRTPDGRRLRTQGGAEELRLTVPHGTGELPEIIAGGGKVDKKGVLSPSLAETRQRQERYLEIYAKVRDFFAQELGRPLFLMYGTLLGYHREGDFIPGDDDFDCGYVSDHTDPAAVKEETKQLIVALVKAGFTVSFNRKGRLFRIQLEREATDGYHLDVRPLWFQDGRVWVHNHCSFASRREDFLPVAEGELRGVRVLAPRDTEKFLRGHYGPGWRVPDPGFMYYLSEIDPAILENLGRALLTVSEYKELAERVRREAGDGPPAGRFVSVGSQDLYPLAQFLP